MSGRPSAARCRVGGVGPRVSIDGAAAPSADVARGGAGDTCPSSPRAFDPRNGDSETRRKSRVPRSCCFCCDEHAARGAPSIGRDGATHASRDGDRRDARSHRRRASTATRLDGGRLGAPLEKDAHDQAQLASRVRRGSAGVPATRFAGWRKTRALRDAGDDGVGRRF